MIDAAYAIRYHLWATRRLLQHAEKLSADQLELRLAGTAGSVRYNLAHLVGAEQGYLNRLGYPSRHRLDEESAQVAEVIAAQESNERLWEEMLAAPPGDLAERHELSDGWVVGSALWAQALHHGNDHRTQVGTILLHHDLHLPWLDVWAYAYARGEGEYPPDE